MSAEGSAAPPPPDLAALSPWAPELAQTFVTLASDIALVVDDAGTIAHVAQGKSAPAKRPRDAASAATAATDLRGWVGRRWADTADADTRPKIEQLLAEAAATGVARRREVNHPLGGAAGVLPVAYTAVRLGPAGPVLAVGRDLRAVEAIQQRYLESQHDIERIYWQARQAEARYQLLFRVATDAVMVVDARSLIVVEANDAAGRLFNASPAQLQGKPAAIAFDHRSRAAVNKLLAGAQRSRGRNEVRARLQGTATTASVSATPFRAGETIRLLVRVRAAAGAAPPG